ncbi:MAG TPA: hypothetical protein VNU94_01260 [Acidobacteriaceae bacterium]|nr:hypothetical protein [Acidobacteriaceae bacterium]
MKITIDNQDGLGAVDYSALLCADKPLQIKRTLNEPSFCAGMVDCSGGARVPVRGARVSVFADNGTVLFTGIAATETIAVYSGAGLTGPVYRSEFRAISDEWLLDVQAVPESGAGYAQSSGQLLKTLTARVDSTLLTTTGVSSSVESVGVYQPEVTKAWSANAGALAGAAYASYHVLNGALVMQTAGSTSHSFAISDGAFGTLNPAALTKNETKELANDITLTGETEPAAYVTEYFLGDGTTSVFQTRYAPMRITKKTRLNDSFSLGVFNEQVWAVNDPGSHLGFSSGGLLLSGGTGYDGQTTLTAIDKMEIGGAMILEAGSVQISSGSNGVLCGLYSGTTSIANCFAGFRVRLSGSNTILIPLVNGSETGTPFTVTAGHTYTLRVRIHCVEMQRVMQTYYTMISGAVTQFGGGLVSAPAAMVFELQDLGLASSTPATVLYGGAVSSSPAMCSFAPVNSTDLLGAIGYIRLTQNGSGWVVSTPPGSATGTRLIGVAGEGVDCSFSAAGKLSFYAGRIPVANELIAVSYRTSDRSVARLADASSIPLQTAVGLPPTAQWMGSVRSPVARSSADCENAAAAVLSFSIDRAAAIAGRYAAVNLQQGSDVWPGDLISVTVDDGTSTVEAIVRGVTIEDGHCAPEKLSYTIAFANDWAEALSMKLSTAVAGDALLPQSAASAPGNVLSNLQQMTLTSYSTTALQVDAGMTPVAGGGLEVRRRDGDFGPGVDQDLVLRSTVRSFTIPRAAQSEEYYVRAYDASTPPVYSRFSSVIAVDLPTS